MKAVLLRNLTSFSYKYLIPKGQTIVKKTLQRAGFSLLCGKFKKHLISLAKQHTQSFSCYSLGLV